MKLIRRLGWMSLALAAASAVQAATPDALFYMMNTPKSVRSFVDHADRITTLVPTWYGVDQDGLVQGADNASVMQVAQAHHVRVMPILSTTGGSDTINQLLAHPAAQEAMNASLIRIAKAAGYVGFQFDFEGVSYLKRDAFTALVTRTAKAMHQAGLQLTIAVVPNGPGYFNGSTAFGRWMWTDWRGVFDLPALARVVDLICLMTYDQNTRWTTPGPVDGMPWVRRQLDYALRHVPRAKLSLGIATYGYHWYTGDPLDAQGKARPNSVGDYIDYDESKPLADAMHAHIQWDADEQESWFYFYRDDMREWVFMPDARSFAARYDLAKAQGLEGFCSWVLGAEDPAIWTVLPSHG